jgi:membrane protein required for colicin V production
MTIDIIVGAIVLVFALIGLASGFWSQILRLGALVSLFFIAPPVAEVIEEPVRGFMSELATPPQVRGVALIVAAVGLYLIMSLLIWWLLKAIRGDRPMSGTNRGLGFVLGAAKGAALCYLILAGLVVFEQSAAYPSVLAGEDWWVDNARESKFVDLVSKHNLLPDDFIEQVQQELQDLGVEIPSADEAEAPEPGPGAPVEAPPATGPNGLAPPPSPTTPGLSPK